MLKLPGILSKNNKFNTVTSSKSCEHKQISSVLSLVQVITVFLLPNYYLRHPWHIVDQIKIWHLSIWQVTASRIAGKLSWLLIGSCQHQSHSCYHPLTHWGWDKMATILQTTFWNAFSWITSMEFCFEFHKSSFLWAQLTISHHCFR